jgi:beta-glucosidase
VTTPAAEADLPVQLPLLPPGFTFGTATASYAVEGAAAADGRGASVWDTFSARPGTIADGSTGVGGHYHRMEEDVALLARLGARGYRFSVAWPRVQPDGRGPANPAGLDFYDRLVDALLERDIEPMVTLLHFDLPQALEDDGGWLNRETTDRFGEYAALVGERLADRVAHWVPVDEPAAVTMLGYCVGVHAPGRTLLLDALAAAHHQLVAHGRGAIALRAAGAASVGCANWHAPVWPASDDDADVGASKLVDALWNGMYLEPMLLGRYPADLVPILDGLAAPGDMATIRQPLDFYGVSYFTPLRVAAATQDAALPVVHGPVVGHPVTDLGWPIVPDALREWLILLRARLRAALPPLVVTASGGAFDAAPDDGGVLDDVRRVDYHAAHLRAVQEAIHRGVDVRGYYCWSLLDGFEWAEGLRARFGLVHVDHETQVRTPKRSFDWLAQVIAAQPRDT